MEPNKMDSDDESTTNGGEQNYEIPVWAKSTPRVGDRIRYNADWKWVWGTVTSREGVDVDEYWVDGDVELITVDTEREGEVGELYIDGESNRLYYERTYDDGHVSWQNICRWGVRRTAEVTVPTSAFEDYDLNDELIAVDGIGPKTAQDLRFAETVGELGAWRCTKYAFGVDLGKRSALSLSMRVDYDVRTSSFVSDDEFSATLLDEQADETEVDTNDEGDKERLVMDGGEDVADEPDIDELHERAQAAMKPYIDDILEAEYTSVFAEDDENWYLNVHPGEWDALHSDGVLTSEEQSALSREYHAIVSDQWRNDDPEYRWSSPLPLGDGDALVLEKPSTDDEDDSGDGARLMTDGGKDVADIDYPATIKCPECDDWAEEETVTYVKDGVDVTYACDPAECGWCGLRAYEGDGAVLMTDGGHEWEDVFFSLNEGDEVLVQDFKSAHVVTDTSEQNDETYPKVNVESPGGKSRILWGPGDNTHAASLRDDDYSMVTSVDYLEVRDDEPEVVTDGGEDVGYEHVVCPMCDCTYFTDELIHVDESVWVCNGPCEEDYHNPQTVGQAKDAISGRKFPRCPCGNRVGGVAELSHETSERYEFRKYCTEAECPGAMASLTKPTSRDEPEFVTDGGTDMGTARDRAWLAVIDLLGDAAPMTLSDITKGANVHENTARSVLHVAEEYGLLDRESPQAHTYKPTIGPLGDVADPEVRRAIRTLIAEANKED